MKRLLPIVSWAALGLGIVAPPVLFFLGTLDHDQTKLAMLVGTLTWFATAPAWMNRDAQP